MVWWECDIFHAWLNMLWLNGVMVDRIFTVNVGVGLEEESEKLLEKECEELRVELLRLCPSCNVYDGLTDEQIAEVESCF